MTYLQKAACFSGAALALIVVTSCSPERRMPPPAGGWDPLDAAWRFAQSITNDANDRAACSERVAMARLRSGRSDLAVRLAKRIEGYRGVCVLAASAQHLARQGDMRQARRLLAEAEERGTALTGWQRDRARARMAEAAAVLGDGERIRAAREQVGQVREYSMWMDVQHAICLARDGQPDAALAAMEDLPQDAFFDSLVSRTDGYRILATAGDLPPGQRGDALEKAWDASASVPGWKRFDLRMEIIDGAAAIGEQARAMAWASNVASNVLASRLPGHIRGPLLGRAAACSARVNATGHVDRLVAAAEAVLADPDAMQNIERPSVAALVGEALATAGRTESAVAAYTRAIEQAAALVNPRPRAIAAVDICLSLHRSGLEAPTLTEGLQALLESFGDA